MIVVYSKDKCSQCEQAKMYLDIKGVEYEVLKLGEDYSLDEVKEIAPTQRTFPVIVDDGVLVGGFRELKEYLK